MPPFLIISRVNVVFKKCKAYCSRTQTNDIPIKISRSFDRKCVIYPQFLIHIFQLPNITRKNILNKSILIIQDANDDFLDDFAAAKFSSVGILSVEMGKELSKNDLVGKDTEPE